MSSVCQLNTIRCRFVFFQQHAHTGKLCRFKAPYKYTSDTYVIYETNKKNNNEFNRLYMVLTCLTIEINNNKTGEIYSVLYPQRHDECQGQWNRNIHYVKRLRGTFSLFRCV